MPKTQTFEIKQFRGLVSGTPKGTQALGFRVLDGFTFKREVSSGANAPMVGALTIANGRRTLFTNEETVSRMLVLWDEPDFVDPAVYTQSSTANTVRYRASWTTAGGTALTYPVASGTDFSGRTHGNLKKIWRGKMGVVGWSTYPTDDRFPLSFCLPGGVTHNSLNDPFTATPPVVTVVAGGSLPATNWNVHILPLRRLTVGNDKWYVSGYFRDIYTVAKTTAAANLSITVSWAAGVEAIMVVLEDIANKVFYDVSFQATSPFTISSLPLVAAETQQYFTEWLANNDGLTAAYRNDRTWIAGNTFRYERIDDTRLGYEVQQNNTATLWYTDPGRPWAFPLNNFITLSITGDITAMATLGDALVVFSRVEIWAITGNTELDFVAQKIGGNAPGCLSSLALCEAGGMLYYLGLDGVYALSNQGVTRVSDPIRDVFASMGSTPTVSMGFDRNNHEVLMALNGVLYVLDLDHQSWSTRGLADIVEGGEVVTITNGAVVKALDDTSTVQTAVLQTDYLDFDMPEEDKFFRMLRVLIENDTAQSATVTITPVKADGTLLAPLPSKTVNAGSRGRLSFNLPGYVLNGRGVAFRLTITGLPGVVLREELSIDWFSRGRRGR
jgi:hypothetical protein